jgi:hypothetical protein
MKRFVACSVVAIGLMSIMALAQTALANPPGGPISGVSRVAANGANLHLVTYSGGERADFAIVGDGDTTLNVIVKDQNGNVVLRTQGRGDRFNVNWTVHRTSIFSIFVINEGGVYNQYVWRAY